jgi:hypothetical protein
MSRPYATEKGRTGRVEDRLLVLDRGLGRGADHGVDQLVRLGPRAPDDLLDEVGGRAHVALRIGVGLDHAVRQRAIELQREAIGDGLVAVERLLAQLLQRHRILGVAHVGGDGLAHAVAGGHRGP